MDAFGIILIILCGIVPWLIDLYKPWHYTIDNKKMTLIYLAEDGKRWSWERLRWYQEVLRSFESSEWRGLPALSITYESYIGRGRRVTAYMVYRSEDAESVRERVIPVLEHHLPHGPRYRMRDRDLAPAGERPE